MDYVGAVRVVSMAGNLIFEKLTKLDSHDMVMCVSARTMLQHQNALCLCNITQHHLLPGTGLISNLAVPAQSLIGCCECREWHIISHPLATNPFPASILNCKASIRVVPVLIPGNQSFVDWKIDLLTELHAVDVMRKLIEGIQRVGLLSESCPSHVIDLH